MSEQKFTFEKKLSIDGVLILTTFSAMLIWIGGLKHTVEEDHDKIQEISAQVGDIKTDVAGVKSDVAVLSAVVVDRTGKPLK